MNFQIAIPSKSRAGLMTSHEIFKSAVIYVPENEVKQYSIYKNKIVGIPVEVKGITATRNWILKNTDDKWVVFIDDDVKSAGYTKLYKNNSKKIEIVDLGFWENEFIKYFDLCEQLKYKIWGVRTENSTRGTQPFKPFLFKGYITASCMGIINEFQFYISLIKRDKDNDASGKNPNFNSTLV